MRQTRYFAFDHRLDRLSVPRPTGKDYDQLTKIVAARDAERTLGSTDEIINVRHCQISVRGMDSDQFFPACLGLL